MFWNNRRVRNLLRSMWGDPVCVLPTLLQFSLALCIITVQYQTRKSTLIQPVELIKSSPVTCASCVCNLWFCHTCDFKEPSQRASSLAAPLPRAPWAPPLQLLLHRHLPNLIVIHLHVTSKMLYNGTEQHVSFGDQLFLFSIFPWVAPSCCRYKWSIPSIAPLFLVLFTHWKTLGLSSFWLLWM